MELPSKVIFTHFLYLLFPPDTPVLFTVGPKSKSLNINYNISAKTLSEIRLSNKVKINKVCLHTL